jgi:hypothetical protein
MLQSGGNRKERERERERDVFSNFSLNFQLKLNGSLPIVIILTLMVENVILKLLQLIEL